MGSITINYDTNYNTTFLKIMDAIENVVGWTLYDDVDSTHKVFVSSGENSEHLPVYLSFDQGSTGTSSCLFEAYQYWSTSTHTGTCKAKNGQRIYFNTDNTYYIGGDKDKIHIVRWAGNTDLSSSYVVFGYFIDKKIDDTMTTLTASASSGTLVTITVADSSGFKEGQTYQIVGSNGEGRYSVVVNNVPSSTSLTLASLSAAFDSGAYIGFLPCPFAVNSGDSNINYHYSPSYRTNTGTTNDTDSGNRWIGTNTLYQGNTDPDAFTGKYIIAPISIYDNDGGVVGYISNTDVGFAYGRTDNDLLGVTISGAAPEFGTCSSGTSTTIYDDSKSWTVDEFVGKAVCIANGTGVNQSRKVASNTSNSLTIDSVGDGWLVAPDSTSMYYIVDMIYRYADNYCFRESY